MTAAATARPTPRRSGSSLGGTLGFANWLNARGAVVGVGDLAGDGTAHPFLWKNGHMRDLGTLGGDFAFASYIANRGDVAGASVVADGTFHGFLWHNGKLVDLPPSAVPSMPSATPSTTATKSSATRTTPTSAK